VFGFLNRSSRFFGTPENIVDEADDKETLKLLHQTISKVAFDIENMKFNTGISALMIFNNLAMKKGKVCKQTAQIFAKILSPYAPHLAEELWQLYGNTETLAYAPWPVVDKAMLTEDVFEYPISFNGKVRFKLEFPVGTPASEIEAVVLAHETTQKWLEGKTPKKVIVVPNKIVNIVI
jgi:leucyl-tRNA synthetase